MNKIFITALIFLGMSATFSAQKTQEQINREYAEQYRKIGEDPSLSGLEKARRKKALALRQKQDNRLYDQAYKDKYGYSRDEKKKQIENRIDQLDKKYDREKDMIDDNDNLSKNQKKERKEALKQKYKNQKELLKREKDNL